jgi:cytochrome c oxidase subunit 4
MSRANEALSYDEHQDVESHTDTYFRVFVALFVFTILEYVYAMLTQSHFLALVLGLVALAVTKATLVAMFFMHLKFEGRWVYLLLAPVGVLATALVLALVPDIGLPPRDAATLPVPAAPAQNKVSPAGAAASAPASARIEIESEPGPAWPGTLLAQRCEPRCSPPTGWAS